MSVLCLILFEKKNKQAKGGNLNTSGSEVTTEKMINSFLVFCVMKRLELVNKSTEAFSKNVSEMKKIIEENKNKVITRRSSVGNERP